MTPISGPLHAGIQPPGIRAILISLFKHALAILFIAAVSVLGLGMLTGSRSRASSRTQTQQASAAIAQNPDAVCAGCHRKIYERYERTPMARASGAAVDGLLAGEFLHEPSGIRYRIFMRNGSAWLSYERAGSSGQAALSGEQQLVYYVGSGHRGRTYLYQQEGRWFEAPINYYTKMKLWDMAPGYGSAKTLPDALPVDSGCLHCHATAVQESLPEARNDYAGAPFLQGGIGCSTCHGDPSKHLAEHGKGPIVNPAMLTAARRDSVCLQCHLEGNVAIFRAGRSPAQFRPGDDLTDYVAYFVKASEQSGGGRATSQYEALLRSACKVASGDNLTCTTCHDPHSSPAAEDRVAYFRGKCLACHTGSQMATRHHPEQPDCTGCHMPALATTDVSHEQTTDHDIQAHPRTTAPTLQLAGLDDSDRLMPIGGEAFSNRELGLAYAQLAEHGDQQAGERALRLLRQAEQDGANDAQVHAQLGFLEQMSGDRTGARKEYDAALSEDAYDATALGNLAVLDAASGQTAEAIALLQRVVAADPGQLAAGLNLAFIECKIDNKSEALKILDRLSRLNPDDPTLRRFVASGVYGTQRCALR